MMNIEQKTEDIKVIQEHEKYKVEFISMTHDGRGVCKVSGIAFDGRELENYPILVIKKVLIE